jgi:hypothetical protein
LSLTPDNLAKVNYFQQYPNFPVPLTPITNRREQGIFSSFRFSLILLMTNKSIADFIKAIQKICIEKEKA